MKNYKIGILFIAISLVMACRVPKFKNSPLPPSPLSVSEELKYIVSTDQKDRKEIGWRIIFGPANRHVREWQKRDSVRVERVYQLYANDSIVLGRDRFNAGLIFFHGNQKYPEQNCYYYKLSFQLFDTLRHETDTSLILNGVHWSKLASEQLKKCK